MPMQMNKPTAEAVARYRDLVAQVLERIEAKDSTMFGMPTLKKPSGKAFCGLTSDGGMVFKLTDAGVRSEALDLPGAHLFDPSGSRPMKEWVVLGPELEDRYLALALAAADGVA